ncbi:DNA-formamidopyrimidine glycosylase [Tumidithrix elongata RA019]|uniref:Formamidopyrimidine-DNA glycosylase n=1 Tax=Tumidithrix elongata BACA0141 TaxID=2716417 RepID=A0AAW9PXG7_9CYAN|nr:DNA-formamidopyrimidine glycosylase [Tumidithrix elongata RA019]
MPELPEVETVRLGLNQNTLGRQIRGGEVLLPRTVAYPNLPTDFLSALAEAAFVEWHRRGKYLLGELSNQSWLGVHLRMTGSLRWCDATTEVHKHTRVRLFFDGEKELRFDDQRTFGQMWWVPQDTALETIITGLQNLGIEPFDPQFTPEYLAQRLQGRDRPIKNALLDQAIVAGIGNIYADECLFLSKIHPRQPASSLNEANLIALHQAIIQVLRAGIAKGGTTFSDFRDLGGDKGNYIDTAWVFRRTGQPCRVCQTAIERIKLAGRSSHFCPQCQPLLAATT